MKALITGVTGFVGPYLTRSFADAGIACVGLGRDEKSMPPVAEYIDCDIRDFAALKNVVASEKPDFIVHLAAITSVPFSFQNPGLTYAVNVEGTVSLFEAVRELGISPRILNVSSAHVYGTANAEAGPFSEKSSLHPESPYASSKAAAELIANDYARSYGMNILQVRAFNHTGPGQSDSFVVSHFARQIAAIELGLQEPVMRVGNLHPKRDFSDVRDVTAAYVSVLREGRAGETYNVCSGVLRPVQEILDVLIDISKCKIEVKVDSTLTRKIEVLELGGDPQKLLAVTSWKPRISLRTTLEDLLSYWKKRLADERNSAGT